jgi:hypothetical protein
MFASTKRVLNILLRVLIVMMLSACCRLVRADTDQEYAVRAGLTSNLARFTSWPATSANTITVCLVGNPAIEEAFSNLNGKAVGDKTLQVRTLSRFNNLSECQLLYISELDRNKLLLLLNEIKALPILTIGEDAFFVKNGGMVSLEIIEGKVSITINLKAAKKANLSISARVLKLATVIQ